MTLPIPQSEINTNELINWMMLFQIKKVHTGFLEVLN
jgi:hypothetical protein